MSDAVKGLFAIAGAATIWGLSSIYYKALDHIPPLEVLSHRTLWSFVFFALVLLVQRRIGELGRLLAGRNVRQVALAAVMISINWFFFIYSVQTGRALGASLGYYIFPLVAVVLGVVIFRETLGWMRGLAVALAVIAVVTLTLGLGVAPWISLTLAFTFGLYGVVKKGLNAGPVASVTGEVALVAPLSLGWLGYLYLGGGGATADGAGDVALLMFSGVLTGLPLILFSFAARRLTYGLVGLMQYINPTLQFLVASLIFLEPVTRAHMVALPLIWTALAIYSIATFRQERASSRKVASASTSSTRVM